MTYADISAQLAKITGLVTTIQSQNARLHNYVDTRFNSVDDFIAELKGLLVAVNDQVAQLQSAITDMQAAQTAAATRINTNMANIESQLQTAIANQTPPPDLSSEIQAVRDETAALNALEPSPTPTPTPAPTP